MTMPDTYESENWMMRPFLDQPIHWEPVGAPSVFFRMRTTLTASSELCDLATLQTRRSPSRVCDDSMSDFCLDDDACQARVTIGEGALLVVRLCRIVKRGCRVAIRSEPFWYL